MIAQRYWAWAACPVLAIAFLLLAEGDWLWFLLPAAIFAILTVVGIFDYTQDRQAIRRNYPVISHFRFFF